MGRGGRGGAAALQHSVSQSVLSGGGKNFSPDGGGTAGSPGVLLAVLSSTQKRISSPQVRQSDLTLNDVHSSLKTDLKN